MIKIRMAWRLIGCSGAMALAACPLAACHSAATRIYSLETAAPATRIESYQAPALRVDTLNVPAGWDRLELLSLSATGTLQIDDFDHWSAPLPQLARQILSEDLDQRLPSGAVIFPRLPKSSGASGLDVDILEFTMSGSRAAMRASWLIVPALGSQSAKRSVASFQTPVIAVEPSAIVRAWSVLMGQLADRIAADAASRDPP
jgi:uncharacterized lipoprotein YmbA